MNNKNNLFNGIRETLIEQVKDAYIEGTRAGAIATCATIYATFKTAGLEESNLLFDILRDLAQKNGCENLHAEVERISITSKQKE